MARIAHRYCCKYLRVSVNLANPGLIGMGNSEPSLWPRPGLRMFKNVPSGVRLIQRLSAGLLGVVNSLPPAADRPVGHPPPHPGVRPGLSGSSGIVAPIPDTARLPRVPEMRSGVGAKRGRDSRGAS